MYKLSDLVKEGFTFQNYSNGYLNYKGGVSGFRVQVPVSDIDSGSLGANERGIYLLKWLRPAVWDANEAFQTALQGQVNHNP